MTEQERQLYTEMLVIRFQQGQPEALPLLVELWQNSLVGFAFRYFDQEADAWDAVQETWIAVMAKLRTVREPSVFTPWLFRILTHKCIDRIRKRQTDQRLVEQATPQPVHEDRHEGNEKLQSGIDLLSAEHRVAVTLRFGQGLSVEQIAAMLNVRVGTVKSRLHRALAQLRDILGEKP